MERLVAASSDYLWNKLEKSFLLTRHQQAGKIISSRRRKKKRKKKGCPLDAIVRSKADAGLGNERRFFLIAASRLVRGVTI